jgi:ATP-dependent metalloprotease
VFYPAERESDPMIHVLNVPFVSLIRHALVAIMTEGSQPIHKATIMPRGNALGMVTTLPDGDQTSQSKKEMLAFLDLAMGGRVAEELIFGADNVTSGAMSDIQSATRVARNMVTKCGFSEQVGIVFHGGVTGEESASDHTRDQIDNEVKKLTDAAYRRAKDLLTKYSKEHKLLAETLLEYETLTGDEVRDIVLKRQKPKRPVINKEGGRRGDQTVVGSDKKTESKPKSRIPGMGRNRAE